MSAAADLSKALRAEAETIAKVRSDLYHSDAERDDQMARDLRNAAEWARILARMVEGKTLHQAFGAPGDFGYDTPIGSALDRIYRGAA